MTANPTRLLRRLLLFDEHVCPWWLAYSFDNPVRRLVHPPERTLGPWLHEGMTAVDLGCGMGHFTLGMARLVGPTGRVVAVDLQPRMLAVVSKRARGAGVAERVELHEGSVDGLTLSAPADFALSFWMAHEVEGLSAFVSRVFALLGSGGRYLIAEPRLHVTATRCRAIFETTLGAGFRSDGSPSVRLSRAMLFVKPAG